MKTLVIGDIHGQLTQFDRLLERAHFSSEKDKLILLGDLIDRGVDSYGVLQRVMQLKAEMNARLIIIRGSHEKMLLSSCLWEKLLWQIVGKQSTVHSFRIHGERLSDYADWIEKNTVLFHTEQYFQCVHAAIKREPVWENDEYTLMMNHFLVKKNQYSGRLTLTGHIHLSQPTYFDGRGGKGIVLPYDQPLPLPPQGIICLDTGCSTAGQALTGMCIEAENLYRLISAQ